MSQPMKQDSHFVPERIGLLGGTFDPVHNGHLALAFTALQTENLSGVWFLLNPRPPHKTLPEGAASPKERLAMLRLAIQDTPAFSVCDRELKEDYVPYTYRTLEKLKAAYPEKRFSFIIGADSLFTIDTWKSPERLLPGNEFLAACRGTVHDLEKLKEKAAVLNKSYRTRIKLLWMEPVAVSSTQVRSRAAAGKSLRGLVPAPVEAYIRSGGLYQTKDNP